MTDNAFRLDTQIERHAIGLVALVVLVPCVLILLALVKPILDAIDGR